jgi:hypothetical protein
MFILRKCVACTFQVLFGIKGVLHTVLARHCSVATWCDRAPHDGRHFLSRLYCCGQGRNGCSICGRDGSIGSKRRAASSSRPVAAAATYSPRDAGGYRLVPSSPPDRWLHSRCVRGRRPSLPRDGMRHWSQGRWPRVSSASLWLLGSCQLALGRDGGSDSLLE